MATYYDTGGTAFSTASAAANSSAGRAADNTSYRSSHPATVQAPVVSTPPVTYSSGGASSPSPIAPAATTLFYGIDKNGNPVYESSQYGGAVNPAQAIAAPYSTSPGQSQAITQNAPAVIASGYNSPTAISAASIGSIAPFNLTQPVDNSYNVNTTMNGLVTTGATRAAADAAYTQAQYKNTPAQQQESDLSKMLQDLNLQEANKPADQIAANTAAGVDEATKTVNDLKAQQTQILNEHAQAQLTTQQGQGVTTAVDTRQRNEETRVSAIAALGVSSLLAAAEGNLAYAQALADKQIGIKYAPIEAKLTALTANLKLIKEDPTTTNQERQQIDNINNINEQNKAIVAQSKDNASMIMKIAIDAAAGGANSTVLANIQNSTDPVTAQQIAFDGTPVQAGDASTTKVLGSASTGYFSYDTATGVKTPISSSQAKTVSGGTTTTSKGSTSSKTFVNRVLSGMGVSYDAAVAAVPAGKIGVVSNATGQIGTIDTMAEYDSSKYTLL